MLSVHVYIFTCSVSVSTPACVHCKFRLLFVWIVHVWWILTMYKYQGVCMRKRESNVEECFVVIRQLFVSPPQYSAAHTHTHTHTHTLTHTHTTLNTKYYYTHLTSTPVIYIQFGKKKITSRKSSVNLSPEQMMFFCQIVTRAETPGF